MIKSDHCIVFALPWVFRRMHKLILEWGGGLRFKTLMFWILLYCCKGNNHLRAAIVLTTICVFCSSGEKPAGKDETLAELLLSSSGNACKMQPCVINSGFLFGRLFHLTSPIFFKPHLFVCETSTTNAIAGGESPSPQGTNKQDYLYIEVSG